MNFQNSQFENAFGTSAQLPTSDLPEIAFSGRSNVGKSSLLNRLLNRKSLARVSSVPGKTVTVNFFKVDNCRFADLPGYGYAKVNANEKKRWADLMEGYFNSGRNIKLVIQLVDMRHDPSKLDMQMIEFLAFNSIPFVVALTKCDKLNKSQFNAQIERHNSLLKQSGCIDIIPFSAVKGDGAERLKEIIETNLKG